MSSSLNQRKPVGGSSPTIARDPDSDSDWDASDEERKQLKKNGALKGKGGLPKAQKGPPKAILPVIAQDDYTGMGAFEQSVSGMESSSPWDPTPLVPPRSPKRSTFMTGSEVQSAELSGVESSAQAWDSNVPETNSLSVPAYGKSSPPIPGSKLSNDGLPSQLSESEIFGRVVSLPTTAPSTVNSQNIWDGPPSRPPPLTPGQSFNNTSIKQPLPSTNPWAEAGASWASHRAVAESSDPQKSLYSSSNERAELPKTTLSIDPTQNPDWSTEHTSPPPSSKKQRNEVYQVKHIRYGPAATENYRSWPILIQNDNGPCPLLALVNALVLSTSVEIITGLIETLRTREQVSLGLLLDAVVDELMSRESGFASQLPDVGELYAFLISLHTGMNVNPRFVPKSSSEDASESAGDFADTREMQLYGTFHIPLIHGWTPVSHSEAFLAFERSAQSYEDVQNLLLREDELETKLQSEDLSIEEQTLYMDSASIKDFLKEWPTQLTTSGLDAIQRTMPLGTFSILFRNDHFSTLYKEPRTGRLMVLVTDAGYVTHDEIIWESLVDVTGVGAEYFSGDFRSVSQSQMAQVTDDNDQGWTTVESKSPRHTRGDGGIKTGQGASSLPQGFSALSLDRTDEESTASIRRLAEQQEQADRDFAMALQMQEEEEERTRTDRAARERENHLSEQFVASETSRQSLRPAAAEEQPPPQPPRPTGPTATRRPPPGRQNEEDAAPPPYEQAASMPPHYGPPQQVQGQPSRYTIAQTMQSQLQQPPQAGPSIGRRRPSQRQSYLIDRVPGSPQSPRSAGPPGATKEEEEKCVIM